MRGEAKQELSTIASVAATNINLEQQVLQAQGSLSALKVEKKELLQATKEHETKEKELKAELEEKGRVNVELEARAFNLKDQLRQE